MTKKFDKAAKLADQAEAEMMLLVQKWSIDIPGQLPKRSSYLIDIARKYIYEASK